MTTPADQIVRLYNERRALQSPMIARMIELRDHYHGEVMVPLPELDKNERAAVANHITQGLEQMAMRISSTVPQIRYYPLKPGNDKSEDFARIRRLATYGWWQMNHFDRKTRKRARQLIGYARTPVVIRPDFSRGIPKWQIRDPLATFPHPEDVGDDIRPRDCIFSFKRTLGWLLDHYPEVIRNVYAGKEPSIDDMFDILEYTDREEHVLIVLGRPRDPKQTGGGYGYGGAVEPTGSQFAVLDRVPNLAGCCTAVIPSRIGLDRPIGQFDALPPLYAMQARAMALWLISGERAIFPDTWVISRPNEQAQIVSLADGRAGIPGVIKGGDMKEVTVGPPPQTAQLVDVLERNQQVTAGLPAEFGGESPTNIRTGRRGESVLSATVDFWVQEAQETLADSFQEENKVAVSVSKAYFGSRKCSFYVNYRGAKGQVDYIPSIHFENDNQTVRYPLTGSDANGQTIQVGQKLGLGTMAARTAMELDPMIDDPDAEHDRVVIEGLERAQMTSIDQAVASGQFGPLEVARLHELVLTQHIPVYKAVQKVHDEAQQQQAQQPGQEGAPEPGSPETQPGIQAPGLQAVMAGMQPPANQPGQAIGPPQPSMNHLQQTLATLKGGGGAAG